MEQNAQAIRDDDVEVDRWEWEGGHVGVLDEKQVLPPAGDSTDNAARDTDRQTRSDFPDSANWPAG